MTPEEAVNKLFNKGLIPEGKFPDGGLGRPAARNIIDACVATARTEATVDETRRCAARCEALRKCCDGTVAPNTAAACKKCRDDILRTGGLEVEE